MLIYKEKKNKKQANKKQKQKRVNKQTYGGQSLQPSLVSDDESSRLFTCQGDHCEINETITSSWLRRGAD